MLQKILFIIVTFLSDIIQSVSGFGGTVIAMPFSIRLVGIGYARPILNAVGILISLVVVIFNFKKIVFKEVLTIIVFAGLGFGTGYFLNNLDFEGIHDIIFKMYGGIIIVIGIYFFFKKDSIHIHAIPLYIILFIAGVFHYLYVSGGPFLVIYAGIKLKDKEQFRATLSFCWVILNSIILTENLVQGSWNLEMLWLFLIISASVVLSSLIGKFLFKHVNKKVFGYITAGLLVVSGISCIF
ncbi:MAG: sulfite exporter TauE/SafE family protein [Gammaproteobacteria bacterium]|nr:sulfite exporter TauE/SafE family protein [Gammaproteobacteria bacterium]